MPIREVGTQALPSRVELYTLVCLHDMLSPTKNENADITSKIERGWSHSQVNIVQPSLRETRLDRSFRLFITHVLRGDFRREEDFAPWDFGFPDGIRTRLLIAIDSC